MRTVTSVEAQNHFGELLDNVQREPISITRRGRPVAFIIPARCTAFWPDARRNPCKHRLIWMRLPRFEAAEKRGRRMRC